LTLRGIFNKTYVNTKSAGHNNSDKAHPVLYVLDAKAVFGTVTETARFLAMLKEIPEIIIVGIGYRIHRFAEAAAFRTRDYTITTVDTWYQETFFRCTT
jgi:predicted alpha/beta superfamily hydrolase